MGARHAQPDDAVAVAVSRRLAGAALVRQCGTMGRADGALCRARRLAGVALSGAAAGLIPAQAVLRLNWEDCPMQLQFVGCGDALGSGGRYNTCFHVTGERVNFLIDCGASSLQGLKRHGIARDDIDLILITHFHGDHFGGLPFLLLDAQFTRRTRPLVIAGPPGIETRLTQLMEALFENSSRTKQRFDLSVVALAPEKSRSFGAVTVTPYPVVHGESGGPFLAYRVGAEGGV